MGSKSAVSGPAIIDGVQTNIEAGSEVLMHMRPTFINGERVVLFESSNNDELHSMVAWCKQHIGRSRGDSSGTWWITKIRDPDDRFRQRKVIAMKHTPYLFMAQLTWA
jgi:hypothetical protein